MLHGHLKLQDSTYIFLVVLFVELWQTLGLLVLSLQKLQLYQHVCSLSWKLGVKLLTKICTRELMLFIALHELSLHNLRACVLAKLYPWRSGCIGVEMINVEEQLLFHPFQSLDIPFQSDHPCTKDMKLALRICCWTYVSFPCMHPFLCLISSSFFTIVQSRQFVLKFDCQIHTWSPFLECKLPAQLGTCL